MLVLCQEPFRKTVSRQYIMYLISLHELHFIIQSMQQCIHQLVRLENTDVVRSLHLLRMAWYFWAFNDFFELFFIWGGMIAQHTSLVTLKIQELDAQFILNFLTASDVYIQPH